MIDTEKSAKLTPPGENTIHKNERNSNLELFRIVVMLLIVAHHYVFNSGLLTSGFIYSNPLSVKSIFLMLFGMWGKVGINCFVLITGYFMCKSKITLKKFLKLLLEIYFYRIIFYCIFLFSGYQPFSLSALIKVILPITSVTSSFTSCYLVFFLFIPFLNILINNMTEKQHILLISLCFFIYVILGTIPKFAVEFNYVSWFMVLYLMASYIRFYPKKWFDSKKITGLATLFFIICSMCSVVAMDWLSVNMNLGGFRCFEFVIGSNKILAVLPALASFCFFKNLKIKNNKFINTVAASTFGVFLIHANSDAMRQWLWKDTLNNVGMYDSNLLYIHSFASVIGIFTICTLIDILRRKLFEEPFFKWFDRKTQRKK